MLFSIIVNNYNYGAYIGDAIDSALAQTYSPLEVIVVDDGSTDNSRAVIAAYGNTIQAIFKENEGQNSACNRGWQEAKGDIILFLDSDDVLLPDAAEKCVTALRGTDMAKVQFLLKRVDAELKPLGGVMPTYGLKGNNIRHDIAQWGHYKTSPTSGNAYSKYFLDKVMPLPDFLDNNTYIVPQDTYFAQLAGMMDKVISIHEVLGLYRVHGDNKSDMGQVSTIAKLRYLFMRDYLREQYQIPWGEKLGFSCKPDRSRFCPNVCKQRFLAYRLRPQGHPVPGDNYWYLLSAGLWGAVRFPYVTRLKQLFIICGFIAIAVMPRFTLKKMIGIISKPEERKGIFRLFKFPLYG